jgi:hypothetical protein
LNEVIDRGTQVEKYNKYHDLILIGVGILLAIVTQYLATHFWQIGNILLGNLFAGTMDTFVQKFFNYWNPSWHGILLELFALGIAILILWLVTRTKEDKQLKRIENELTSIKGKMPSEYSMNRLNDALERIDGISQKMSSSNKIK